MAASTSPGHGPNRDALLQRSANLTWELTSIIIDHLVGTPVLSIVSDNSGALIRLGYEAEMAPFNLPSLFKAEYEWHLRRRWLRSRKTFYDATDFVLLHLACFAQQNISNIDYPLITLINQLERFPNIMRFSPDENLSGLESIELALPTDVFFTIFRVTVPPFPTADTGYYHEEQLGAGTFLALTRALTLTFSTSEASSNPWSLLLQGHWADEDENGARPNERGNVCSAGLIVDWILTYAWHHKYLQHIPEITLKGDIQDWMKVKWNKIFTGTHPEQDSVAGLGRIADIEHHGLSEAIAAGKPWGPLEYYPPTCRCSINCSRLREGKILTEIPAEQELQGKYWQIDTQEDSFPPEPQDWFNNDGSDWVSEMT